MNLYQLNYFKKQVYCILMDKKWIKCALNCEEYFAFERSFIDLRIINA